MACQAASVTAWASSMSTILWLPPMGRMVNFAAKFRMASMPRSFAAFMDVKSG